MYQKNMFIDQELSKIPGLLYLPDFISKEQELLLLDAINQQNWHSQLKRRVQQYGWEYDYVARKVSKAKIYKKVPSFLEDYCNQLYARKIFSNIPNQIIVNEYCPGQGIAPHIDCADSFGGTIASLSLASHCVMNFSHSEKKQTMDMMLEPCSLAILKGEARYQWKHGIAARKTDSVGGIKIIRNKRVSITFRTVV